MEGAQKLRALLALLALASWWQTSVQGDSAVVDGSNSAAAAAAIAEAVASESALENLSEKAKLPTGAEAIKGGPAVTIDSNLNKANNLKKEDEPGDSKSTRTGSGSPSVLLTPTPPAPSEKAPSSAGITKPLVLIPVNGSTPSSLSSSSTSTTASSSSLVSASKSSEMEFLPAEGAAEKEHSSSLSIFFALFVLVLCIFLIHFMLRYHCHYIPESLAVVFLGALVGLLMKLLPTEDVKKVESFSPTMFFLVLLPPIIFESGYNLHKGNFFTNIGSILLFAIVGTSISALVVGAGVYLMGVADLVYPLDFVQSFAFGSLISAVDPVATLAIFQALDVDPVLNMLVFGESILNDAVAIVLTTTVVESGKHFDEGMTTSEQIWYSISRFVVAFLGSAGIGSVVGLVSSLILKHVDLCFNPSLEFALMLCFVYIPYALAEGIHLSGIMAILFCGIVMSQYTHYNLSPVTQITMQQTMRTLSFVCETCVFAYLGIAIFSFPHRFEPALIVWSIIFILAGRALNIFPLAALCNRFRTHRITGKMMLIMWFSGLRGAIAYAISLHLEFDEDTRRVIVTTTLVVVLFTTVILGGGTMPLMKYLESRKSRRIHLRRRRSKRAITMSKTVELGTAVDTDYLSEFTETETDMESVRMSFETGSSLQPFGGFASFDLKYIRPFLIRRFTNREVDEGKSRVTQLTDKWIKDVQGPSLLVSDSDEEFGPNKS